MKTSVSVLYFLLILLFIASIFASCAGDDDDSSSRDGYVADDDTANDDDTDSPDDDINDDVDDDVDDDADDDTEDADIVCTANNSVLRPNCRVYYGSGLFEIASDLKKISRAGGSLSLDDRNLPLLPSQWMELDPGLHRLKYTYENETEEVTFRISDEGIVSEIDTVSQPETVTLNDVTGNGIPVEYLFENTGSQKISGFKFYTQGEQYFWSKEDLVAELQNWTWLDSEAKAIFAFDIVVWKTQSGSPLLYNQPENDCPPGYFVWGGGFCGNQSQVMGDILVALGYSADDLLLPEFPDHQTILVRWDDAWHLFDPYHAVFFRRLDNDEIADIQYIQENPDVVSGRADQFGNIMSGSSVDDVLGQIQAYQGIDNLFYPLWDNCSPVTGGWEIYPGETLRVTTLSNGQTVLVCPTGLEDDCSPLEAMAQVSFERPLQIAAGVQRAETWVSPTPLNSMTIFLDVSTAGDLEGELILDGVSHPFSEALAAGDVEVNFSALFDHGEGLILDARLQVYSTSTVSGEGTVLVGSQISPKRLPMIDRDQRSFEIAWDEGDSDVEVTSYYQDVQDAGEFIVILTDPMEVLGDGRARYSLFVLAYESPLGDVLEAEPADGLGIELVADMPVEILPPAQLPRDQPGRNESHPTNITGPMRSLEISDRLLGFVVFGQYSGDVEFTLRIDGQQRDFQIAKLFSGGFEVSDDLSSSFILKFVGD